MTLFKINKNNDFTVMSNYHLRDKNLSLKAKGLLSFMLSLPDDWDYSLKGLVAICKESRDSIRATLNELKAHNYLEIDKLRGENGVFEYNYLIYEKPSEKRLKIRNPPDTGFPDVDNPDVENPTQINTKEQKDIIDKLDKMKSPLNANFSEENKNSILTSERLEEQEIKHNNLTLELIRLGYINENEVSSFMYDDLFRDYLSQGRSYRDLYIASNYIVSCVVNNNFLDEAGEEINNKYSYFKKSLKSNFRKLDSIPEKIFNENDASKEDDELEWR